MRLHAVTCNSCPAAPDPTAAEAHEATHPGHRVTLWDTSRSQLPRFLWPTQEPAPAAVPAPRGATDTPTREPIEMRA